MKFIFGGIGPQVDEEGPAALQDHADGSVDPAAGLFELVDRDFQGVGKFLLARVVQVGMAGGEVVGGEAQSAEEAAGQRHASAVELVTRSPPRAQSPREAPEMPPHPSPTG
ncbi:hypothetical protein [Streptomyces sp. NPDC050560]|uniref:hypothetical protein n=1 Tax=Streptomyces sp. NPDC050560 TaxID=3365630 RepID=UPI0037B9469F